jgi:GAF domain-containing protein
MKVETYNTFLADFPVLFSKATPFITLLANLSAELNERFLDYAWVGFYLLSGDKLILGPFQGKPACEEIKVGHGVCGTSALQKKTIIVPDVIKFPGHIACDSKSRSEIVVPLLKNGKLWGVLDVDSYDLDAFDEVDASKLEALVDLLNELVTIPESY